MVFLYYSLQLGSFNWHWVQYDWSHVMYFVGFQDVFLLLWFLGPSSTALEGELISPFWFEHDRIYIDLSDYLIHLSDHQVRQKCTQDWLVTFWNLRCNYSYLNFSLFLYTYNVVEIFLNIKNRMWAIIVWNFIYIYITSPWISLLGILLQIWSIGVLPFLVGFSPVLYKI